MPGWIIQGVRGEGKSLCAVGKIREYMLRGCPVATNLDLFLDVLLPPENNVISYRLPDHPRLDDFEALPPAYDVKYKGEDKNGLLVLDELGTWLNSRSWNDKTRLKLLNWLFLSRKNHWDLILLAQDHEMIDTQVRNTLCDYLVQASRLDRQKIPFLAPALEFLGINSFMPKLHVYHVFYGMSTNQKPVEKWQFTGKNLYEAYDTNQRFKDGHEPLNGSLVDMRAVYSFIPANYLTGHIHIDRLHQQIKVLKDHFAKKKVETMAFKQTSGTDARNKAVLFSVFLIGFLIWRFASGNMSLSPKLPKSSISTVNPVPAVQMSPQAVPNPIVQNDNSNLNQVMSLPSSVNISNETATPTLTNFVATLFQSYKARLTNFATSTDGDFFGSIDFLESGQIVERFNIKELHALGVSVVSRPYGVDLHYSGQIYVVTNTVLPDIAQP